jgi:Sec-independent protein translocase protein TatA
MRYLLLSVLVVSLVGIVIVPSAFAETPPMIVDVLLPTNEDVEHGWDISNTRGDRSYPSSFSNCIYDASTNSWTDTTGDVDGYYSGCQYYIQGYEKTYVRSAGYGDSVTLSAAVFHVTTYGGITTNQEMAEEERDRKFSNARNNTPAGYSDFSPWGFPSECDGIKEDFGLAVKITAYCLTGDYYYSVIALGGSWDIDNDVVDFTKAILNKIGVAAEAAPTPPTPELSTGCGEGTVLVDGVCRLAETSVTEDDMSSAGYVVLGLFILLGIPIIIIGVIVILIRGRKKTPKLTKQERDDYEDVKEIKRKIKDGLKTPKPVKKEPAKKKETSAFCENCGNTLNPKAKFCGSCGTPVS